MKLIILVVIMMFRMAVFLINKLHIRRPPTKGQKFWLFYAGPENYLDENGERDYQGEIFWSCEPETRKGDLILLYRKSINQLTVNLLISKFNMTKELAQDIKKKGLEKIFQLFGKRYPTVKVYYFGDGRMAVTCDKYKNLILPYAWMS